MTRKGPPPGYHTVTPRVVVGDVVAAVEFLRATFDAVGEAHADRPAEIRIGDSRVMLSAVGERESFPAFLYVYVEDADAIYRRALAAGAVSVEEPIDTPYGDRRAMVRDPFGNVFQIASSRRDTVRALVIGLDPTKLEGWDPEPVVAAIARGHARFGEHGIEADQCLVDPEDNPETAITEALTSADYACVVVGGGIRKHEPYLELFENVVNLVRRHAPGAAIAFNDKPDDTADAALRWLR